MYEYYVFLSRFTYALYEPVNALLDQINVPVISAVLLGLLGMTSP